MSYESIIATTIALMILSQINERFANFMKLWLSGRQLNPLRDSDSTRVRNLRSRMAPLNIKLTPSSGLQDLEKEREEGILFLNILCGWVIAWGAVIALNGTSPTPDPLKWITTSNAWTQVFLVLLGGFFLSFGSKFFHDLLDLLFEIKRAKEKLTDPETYRQQNLEDLETYLAISSEAAARRSLQINGNTLRNRDGVVAIGVGVQQFEGIFKSVLEVHLRDQAVAETIESHFTVDFSGQTIKVPVVPMIGEVAELMEGAQRGGRIKNRSEAKRTGTLGCVVRDVVGDDRYLLSCYHVMRHLHDWTKFRPTGDESIELVNNGAIGELVAGCRTRSMDIAIARVLPGANITNNIGGSVPLTGTRTLSQEDVIHRTTVWFRGANREESVQASIYGIDRSARIAYPDGIRWMDGLIFIADLKSGSPRCPNQPGDSGAIVHDRDGKAIGVIVAGNKQFGYAIPITAALGTYDLEIA